MLLLLPGEPVARGDALRALRPLLEPVLERGAQLRVGGVALGERDVREGAVEPGQQLAQRAQTLQLARPVDAVALRRPREARSGRRSRCSAAFEATSRSSQRPR